NQNGPPEETRTRKRKFLPFRYAPINTPIHKRRETASVMLWIALMPLLFSSFLLLLLSPSFYTVALAYIVFLLIDTAPETGGRQFHWLRRLPNWKWMSNFFPMRLVKTCDLDPKGNYMFAYHPHGIISLGAFCMFGTEARSFSSVFPGIDLRVLTLSSNFTMLVPGGAAESLYAFPNRYDLVIKRRLGFIKLALKNGASLVPVIAFGETNVYDQVDNPKGSLIRTFQDFFQKYASFAPPFFHGRGVLQYDFGILPHRRELICITGAPIPCARVADPSREQLLAHQKRYLDALEELFAAYKDEYAPTAELCFVE
ncbi:MAG: hypothetical protein SGCHY_004675, partial [Lobulomycetales sp.]